jgi:hypothetical protein
MSTTSVPPRPPSLTDQVEVRIYSHSLLVYWWPVWACCFVMALWTYFDGHRLAILPPDTHIAYLGKEQDRNTYNIVTRGTSRQLEEAKAHQGGTEPVQIRLAENSRLGAIFVVILLSVIVITNVPLRGLWSVVVIVIIVLTAIILALANLWDDIFRALGNLHIYINMAGYLFIGIGLLATWIFSTFFFDRQTYMIFTPGQLKVCLEIGGGETAYDTQGMTIEKKRDDLFRHWILGLGSGDLTVRTSGASAHVFEMHNVLFISSKLKAIEEMQRERPTVQG